MRNRKGRLTPEERKARLDAAHKRLTNEVDQLVTSDGWRQLIVSRAWLRRYSLNNVLMIVSQCQHASDVRPFSQWSDAGRRVRKGEKAIRIFAPCRYRARDEDGQERTDPNGKPLYTVRGFKLVPVFDVSQTDGDPVPDPADSAPAELRGTAPEQLWDRVAAQITARGFQLERGDCGPAYGWTDFTTHTVRVRADVHDAQAVKTLVHELAHIACDHESRRDASRAVREVEAESVACVVAAIAGLDSLAYSVPYVAGWAGSAETARASAERVLTVADAIVTALAPTNAATTPHAANAA